MTNLFAHFKREMWKRKKLTAIILNSLVKSALGCSPPGFVTDFSVSPTYRLHTTSFPQIAQPATILLLYTFKLKKYGKSILN